MSGKSGRPAIESRGTACMNEIEKKKQLCKTCVGTLFKHTDLEEYVEVTVVLDVDGGCRELSVANTLFKQQGLLRTTQKVTQSNQEVGINRHQFIHKLVTTGRFLNNTFF